jgi:hypothetical protein
MRLYVGRWSFLFFAADEVRSKVSSVSAIERDRLSNRNLS